MKKPDPKQAAASQKPAAKTGVKGKPEPEIVEEEVKPTFVESQL
jgi:hypothetical protein